MIKENMCKKALACDVAPMPLKSAEEHINREGLSDRIGTVLSDGLDNVPPEGITDVVMAGMRRRTLSSPAWAVSLLQGFLKNVRG